MFHGVALGGGAIMGLVAALFFLHFAQVSGGADAATERSSRAFTWLTIAIAALVWAAVLGGTFIVFPVYRVPPPEGVANLAAYPRAFLLSQPDTAWLHAVGMEIKEHIPWAAAMLSTAVAFIAVRYRGIVLEVRQLRSLVALLLWIVLLMSSAVGILGVFVNKVAPVQ
jgi:hypothetical protein